MSRSREDHSSAPSVTRHKLSSFTLCLKVKTNFLHRALHCMRDKHHAACDSLRICYWSSSRVSCLLSASSRSGTRERAALNGSRHPLWLGIPSSSRHSRRTARSEEGERSPRLLRSTQRGACGEARRYRREGKGASELGAPSTKSSRARAFWQAHRAPPAARPRRSCSSSGAAHPARG